MRQAVAVLMVPDDIDINELCITFDLEKMLNQDGDTETIWSGISEPLSLLPEKLDEQDYTSCFTKGFAMGYNAFRNKITLDITDKSERKGEK